MKAINRLLCVLLSVMLLFTMFSDYESGGGQQANVPVYSSYRDIPGVTDEEINAIESLREKAGSFAFGMMPNTEAFINNKDGEIRGYTALFCEWLTELFGIPFIPEHCTWNNLLEGLENGLVDFTGTLTANDERRQIYYMTDAIAQRAVKYIRLANSAPLSEIATTRLPRYALLAGSTTVDKVLNSASEEFEPVYISEYVDAYELLKTGEIDALVAEGTAEAIFDVYGDIVASIFLPLIYTSVSFTTQNPEFAPIISVMQKALLSGAIGHLNKLYNQGYQEYLSHKLFMQFSEEELAFINANPVIPLAAEYDNYPISFFNDRENKWQGITFDVLREIKSLTGLEFEIINNRNTEWPELLKMLVSGEALMITELLRTPDRIERFLWPKSLLFMDKTALISKTDFPDIGINEVLSVRVGLSKDTAHTELFWRWFPDHNKAIEYESKVVALEALMRGEVDMVMTYLSSLLFLTHYQEVAGFKANFVFNHGLESTFGLNKDATLLCSIVDKAIDLIDIETISGRWLRMTYDYRLRVTQAQIPWIIGAAVLFLAILIILITFQIINNRKREIIAAQNTIASNYEYANKLSSALTKITKSPTISAGVLKETAMVIAQEGCHALNAARVTVWRAKNEELKSISCYDISTGEHTVLDDFDLSNRRGYAKLLKFERLIVTNDLRVPNVLFDLVDEYGPNLCAVLDATIRIDGELAGVVCIEQDRCEKFPEKREWTIEEQNFASSLADLMALTISGAERRAARDDAEESNKAKSRFLAVMSHEIRTPMNSIMGFAELALDTLDNSIAPQIRDYLGKIKDSTKWLLNIINDILDISKIEAGKMELEHTSFDLHNLISRCESVILPSVKEKGLDLRVYAEPLPGKKLLGDSVRLYQVLMNLLSNAVKFTDTGTVSFSSSVKNPNDDSTTVYFEVKDSGIGMSKPQIKKIFEPFVQADSSTTRDYGGTGLGLAITKNIVELMGGKLAVKSEPGLGSTFSFEIVFETIDASDDAPYAKLELLEKPRFDGLILVCDDNPVNRELVCEHLARVGLRTVVAENGKAGVEMVEGRRERGEAPFDIIFMDMFMPVMDGVEAALKIRAFGTGTPIVAMTANVMPSELEKYKASGMPDCLGKPFTTRELWSVLFKYLTLTAAETDDRQSNDNAVPNNLSSQGTHDPRDEEMEIIALRSFIRNNREKYAEIAEAIESGDIPTAHRLTHSLKGNAGMIGRLTLQKSAADLEAELLRCMEQDDEAPSVSAPLMIAIKNGIEQVFDELSCMENGF